MTTTYLFIDGAYLRARLKYVAKTFSTDPLQFDYRGLAIGAQKAFYYDCLPARSPEESTDAYDRRVAPERKELDRIRRLPGYHVFLGDTIRSGGTTRQKGVDILIAVHMMTYAFRCIMDQAILFAGDRDFTPLVSALVQEEIYTLVAYHPKSISQELLDAADVRSEYDSCWLWGCTTPQFRARFPAPERVNMIGIDRVIPADMALKIGKLGNEEVRLYVGDGNCTLYLPFVDDNGQKVHQRISHPDETIIMKLLEERDIVVSWQRGQQEKR